HPTPYYSQLPSFPTRRSSDLDEAELPHDGKKLFDHARTAEWSGGDAANSDHLMNIFFQIHVERVLQQSGVAMIVFRRHEDEPIADRKSTRLNSSHQIISYAVF